MDLNERLEKLNRVRIDIIEIEGEIKKLEFRQQEGISQLDAQGIGHLLFGQDYGKPLDKHEINYIAHVSETMLNERLTDLEIKRNKLQEQAMELLND